MLPFQSLKQNAPSLLTPLLDFFCFLFAVGACHCTYTLSKVKYIRLYSFYFLSKKYNTIFF